MLIIFTPKIEKHQEANKTVSLRQWVGHTAYIRYMVNALKITVLILPAAL
jgi:hypothetical protein